MLKTLDHRARLVALEAHHTSDVLGLVKGVYEDVTHAFGNFVAHFNPSEQPALHLSSDQAKFLRDLGAHPYMGIRGVTTFTPEGLNVPYLTYLEALEAAVQHTAAMSQDILNPFSTFLSQLVSHHDTALSTQRLDILYPSAAANRARLNQKIGACFLAGSSRTERAYEDSVARNSDWPQLFKQLDQMVQAINKIDRKALDKKAHECVELLELIKKKIERNDFGDMSPEVAQNLSAGAFQVASELEFYAAVYYRVLAFSGAINRTVERLRQNFAH